MRRPWTTERTVAAAALGLVLLVAGLGYGQDQATPPPGVTAWEYRTLVWTVEDTEAVLREVTGSDELVSVESMAESLSRAVDLRDHPQVLAAVERRVSAKLQEVGPQGWEAFWMREDQVNVAGQLMPAPAVFLKRPAAK